MTQDTQTVEEIIKEFIYTVWYSRLKESDYTTDDEEERAHPTDMFVNWLRAHLTTYGNARYEEGVKAERERVMEILEKTKDRVDCKKPACDTCKQSLARNAGLDRAIYLLSDNK